jgi:putative holliday junction resolvase
MRILGLDVGSKTIGVAVSDELGLAANPVETIARRGTAADVERVVALLAEREAGAIVIGIPLDLRGREGHRARRVRVFLDALRKRLGDQVPIHEWDERFSTVEAERVLRGAELSARRRKQMIDQAAAVTILQGWLDARGQPS